MLHTLHLTLHTLHLTLHTLHLTLHTVHFTVHALHSTCAARGCNIYESMKFFSLCVLTSVPLTYVWVWAFVRGWHLVFSRTVWSCFVSVLAWYLQHFGARTLQHLLDLELGTFHFAWCLPHLELEPLMIARVWQQFESEMLILHDICSILELENLL